MLKLIKKMYNCFYIFHRTITKQTRLGLTIGGIFFISLLLVVYFINTYIHIGSVVYVIANSLIILYIFLIISYYQLMFIILKKDKKNKKMSRVKFCSNKNYFFYCLKTMFIFTGSIIYILKFSLHFNVLDYFVSNIFHFITLGFILFSIVSLFWFSYIIIYKLLEIKIIKTKLNLYIAIASTINLFQIMAVKEYLVSFGVIIVSYRWISYLISVKDV